MAIGKISSSGRSVDSSDDVRSNIYNRIVANENEGVIRNLDSREHLDTYYFIRLSNLLDNTIRLNILMDKSWISIQNKGHPSYEKGAEDSVEFASANRPNAERILCPCKKCRNMIYVKKDDVVEYILLNRFLESYTCWTFHGESSLSSNPSCDSIVGDEMREMIHDAFGIPPIDPINFMDNVEYHPHMEGPDEETKKFFNLIKEAERELYPACKKYSTLSFLVRLLHIKCLGGWSDKSFTMLLELLKDAFPEGVTLPKSFYEARKLIANLGLEYKKIHACPNDCMLYWNETEKENECNRCHTPRYKQLKVESDGDVNIDRKIPAKVVRYFSLIPRLQRLFMSSKTASQMRWHAEERINDGNLRHPADSLAWKTFDEKYPDFAVDPRNVKLGLSSDRFNPFRSMSITHRTWPVILIPYNLPPWLCMKQPSMILSILIDGPRGPGNDIDVYLQPLIDELKKLWVGVDTYDAFSNQMFKLRASLLWTISDFPAYAILSGWSTKGKLACPCCHKYTHFLRLPNGSKQCYMGHRRWLPEGHKFRMDKVSFDGTIELDRKPNRLSGDEVYAEIKDINNKFGKNLELEHKRRRTVKGDGDLTYNWKKRSIFFELDYWKDNLLRHNLDIMHIKKNVCDNVLWTILNVDGKGKDNLNARKDLKEIGIRKPLHPQKRTKNKYYLPPACFTLDNKRKDIVCKMLKEVKVPDGYSSNISRRVNIKQRTISGLKSHDNHILMQELLPISLRNVLPKNVLGPLIELSNYFRSMYSKVMNVNDLEHVQSRIELTLCHLERIFPPAFFDVMEHLVIHLAEEAIIGGPPHYRMMYPVERYLSTLKNYVRTRSHPEGSIAQGYWVEECLTFCSRYLNDIETKSSRPVRNDEGVSNSIDLEVGRKLGKSMGFVLDDITYAQAHRYVLVNTDAVAPFRDAHRMSIRSNSRLRPHDVDRIHNETFHLWFKDHVTKLIEGTNVEISQEVRMLALGPLKKAKRFTGYIINGVRYHIKARERNRTTQNSGVMLKATTESYASARDRKPTSGDVNFYGILTDIIELYYSKEYRFVLFKCDWVDNSRGLIERDDFGFTLVNFCRLLYTRQQMIDEPFILATQAKQVFYVQDPVENDWHIVVKTKPRDSFDVFGEQFTTHGTMTDQTELWSEQNLDETSNTCEDDISWVRQGVDGVEVDEEPSGRDGEDD